LTSGAAIEVADLSVERGGREVLPGISLSVPGGTITGLLGPSGCGKTTPHGLAPGR
jgi:ABC-2 type transport system ATP-binding protein